MTKKLHFLLLGLSLPSLDSRYTDHIYLVICMYVLFLMMPGTTTKAARALLPWIQTTKHATEMIFYLKVRICAETLRQARPLKTGDQSINHRWSLRCEGVFVRCFARRHRRFSGTFGVVRPLEWVVRQLCTHGGGILYAAARRFGAGFFLGVRGDDSSGAFLGALTARMNAARESGNNSTRVTRTAARPISTSKDIATCQPTDLVCLYP